MTLTIRRKITLGVVIGSRAFFSPAPCQTARTDVLAQLASLGIDAVTLPYEATKMGRSNASPTPNFTPSTSKRSAITSTVW